MSTRSDASLPAPRVLAGIDEAGLGPLLGPLTIGCSAFRVRDAHIDPWAALAPVVSRRPSSDRRRIVVADSKIVFTRDARGARRLESTALSFMALRVDARRPPACARELLACACEPFGVETLIREAWYAKLAQELPRCIERGALEIRIARLARELARNELELVSAHVRVLPVGALNASFEATNNKSISHWDAFAPVLTHLWQRHGREGLSVVVDRHGGRMRYASLLRASFPECEVEIVHEQPVHSEYVLRATRAGSNAQAATRSTANAHAAKRSDTEANDAPVGAWMRVAFIEKADRDSFAVALASCFAKYVRETCMDAFNAYFGALQPDLRPTAGYTQDGRRWLSEAAPAIERSGLARVDLVRAR